VRAMPRSSSETFADPGFVALRDGTPVLVRPLVAADRPLVRDLFERLSPRSRYLRFLTPMPRLPARMLDALAAVHDRRVAWIAFAGGRPAGMAEAVRTGDGEAELAVMVADALHRRGLGTLLLARVRADAAARGIGRLVVEIHPDNAAAVALACGIGMSLQPRDGLLHGARNERIDSRTRSRSAASGTWYAPSSASRRASRRPAASSRPPANGITRSRR
jgi:GNAT superfamily N-acetyltransferase